MCVGGGSVKSASNLDCFLINLKLNFSILIFFVLHRQMSHSCLKIHNIRIILLISYKTAIIWKRVNKKPIKWCRWNRQLIIMSDSCTSSWSTQQLELKSSAELDSNMSNAHLHLLVLSPLWLKAPSWVRSSVDCFLWTSGCGFP